jgi:hypothetical protein
MAVEGSGFLLEPSLIAPVEWRRRFGKRRTPAQLEARGLIGFELAPGTTLNRQIHAEAHTWDNGDPLFIPAALRPAPYRSVNMVGPSGVFVVCGLEADPDAHPGNQKPCTTQSKHGEVSPGMVANCAAFPDPLPTLAKAVDVPRGNPREFSKLDLLGDRMVSTKITRLEETPPCTHQDSHCFLC